MNKWIEEAKASLEEALKIAKDGTVPEQNLYKLAPIVYSNRQNTNDEALINEMIEVNEEQVAEDWSHDENSKRQYKFHYVSSYLFGFVVAGKITEFQYDDIMEQVCQELDLFTEDYTGD